MGRPSYACTTCSEHFTRKYSANRHNITVHHNTGGEIVTLVEYLVGRKSGRYQASDPSWYRRSEKFYKLGRPTIADSIGDAPGFQRQQQGQYHFHQQSLGEQERYHRQWQLEQSLSLSPTAIQNQPPQDVLPYPTDQTFQSQSTDDEKTTTLSQETTLKIQELKRLVYRYAQYYRNPDAIIKCATYWSINGDNMILDEMLELSLYHYSGI